MSSKTTNYNLHKIDLTDAPPDITIVNQNWDIIDVELAKRATLDDNNKIPAELLPSGKSFEVTVPTSGWTTSGTMKTRTISVSGITANSNPIYGLKPSGDYITETEEEMFSLIKGLVTGSNTITLYASEVPTTSIKLTLLEV